MLLNYMLFFMNILFNEYFYNWGGSLLKIYFAIIRLNLHWISFLLRKTFLYSKSEFFPQNLINIVAFLIKKFKYNHFNNEISKSSNSAYLIYKKIETKKLINLHHMLVRQILSIILNIERETEILFQLGN